MTRMRAVDAFCGAGGLSLGLADSGFDVVFGFDLDSRCVETMRANSDYIKHPVAEADIRTMLNGGLLDQTGLRAGELDLLVGGPPCQGFSVQRTIGDDDDDRNNLVSEYGSLIIEVLPRFFVLENVPGIGGARGRTHIANFKTRMSDVGYLIHERTLDAQHYGVPQRRRRFVIVGERDGSEGSSFKWPEPLTRRPRTVREVIEHLPPPPIDGTDHPEWPNHRADRLSDLNKRRLRALLPGQSRTSLPDDLLADCHRISADIVGHRNVYGRMEWDGVSPTITARFDSFTRGKFGHPAQTRSISLREGALLQTFPERYFFVGSKVEVARQIGNAVPPVLGRALGTSILAALNASTSDSGSK
jgi:DNA (cytosine-5)-methyltransferase 1